MTKKLLLLFAASIFSLHMISCTSSGGSEDSEEMTTESGEASDDGLDVDSAEHTEGATDAAPTEAATNQDGLEEVASDTATAETLPDDALASSPSDSELSPDDPMPTDTAAVTPESLTPTETAMTDQAPVPDSLTSTSDVPSVTDSSSDSYANNLSSNTSEKSLAASGTTANTYSSSGGTSSPIQKVALTPWKVDGVLFNAVYFAKPGDTLKSISKTIYGADKTKDLKKGNPMFKSRAVKPGDKVYYTSLSRPQDDTRVLSYYEDQGMQPEVYVSKDGDTVKSVSKQVFGYRDGWKELYSMNSFESKGVLPSGTEIRYFPYSKNSAPMAHQKAAAVEAAPVPDMAMNVPPPAPHTAPPPPDMGVAPPPPAPDMGMAPPPPPTEAMAELPPPPPPPPEQQAPEMAAPPPPPPPPVAERPRKKPEVAEEVMEAPPIWEDPSILMGAGCLALIAIGGIFVVRSRKKKQAELDAALNQHVGT